MDTRPLRADARRNREKIVTAARDAFAATGLDTQMDDIARGAGVGVGTLYRNFPTKDALVAAIVLAQMEENAQIADDLLARDGCSWECFEDFVRRAGMKDQALAEVMATQPAATFIDALQESGLAANVAEMMRRAQADGKMRPDASIEDVQIFMCGMGAVLRNFGPDRGRRYADIMLAGMRAS
jgi:AcrR family transcriptional regulator